jgi:integrase
VPIDSVLSPQAPSDAANTCLLPKGADMARRRYQTGCVYRRGNVWLGRWREDVVTAEGKVVRKLRTETYNVEDYPTKKSVQRELQRKLAEVNARNYRAKPQTKFEVFALNWESTILPKSMKPSTQSTTRSQIRKHLIPAFGSIALSNLTAEPLQRFVAESTLSGKTVRNLIGTLRIMWGTAKTWGLVEHDPFKGWKLPRRTKPTVRYFTAEEMRLIIETAPEPYKTFFWLAAETGMRGGELCGLRWEDVDSNKGIVQVRQSAWRGNIGTPKTTTSERTFAISVALAGRLAVMRSNSELLFHGRTGRPWDTNLVVKRKLHPLLRKLGIERAGMHAFRHGNATVLDQANVPAKVRMSRLGHADLETTFGYTHAVTTDDQKAAEELQRLIFETKTDIRPRLTWQIAGGNA